MIPLPRTLLPGSESGTRSRRTTVDVVESRVIPQPPGQPLLVPFLINVLAGLAVAVLLGGVGIGLSSL